MDFHNYYQELKQKTTGQQYNVEDADVDFLQEQLDEIWDAGVEAAQEEWNETYGEFFIEGDGVSNLSLNEDEDEYEAAKEIFKTFHDACLEKEDEVMPKVNAHLNAQIWAEHLIKDYTNGDTTLYFKNLPSSLYQKQYGNSSEESEFDFDTHSQETLSGSIIASI